MKPTLGFWCLVLTTLTIGCYFESGEVSVESSEYSFSSFIESIESFPYDAPASKQKKLVEAFPSLELGMHMDSVRELLGEPDADFLHYAKGKQRVFLGSAWGYYLHRHEVEFVDDAHDRSISVHFDASGQLYLARLDNVDSVVQKGDPWGRRTTTRSKRSQMNQVLFYLRKFLVLIPCVLILTGAVMRCRRNRHWSNALQVVGPAIILLPTLLDWIFWDPHLGLFRSGPHSLLGASALVSRFGLVAPLMIGGGLVLFCVGYMVAARLDSPSVNGNTEP